MRTTSLSDHLQQPLIKQLYCPDNFWQRLRGLIGRPQLTADEGLFLPRCAAIHMLGMRLPLDIVFLDKELRVQRIVDGLKPGRFARCSQSYHTLELGSGAAQRLKLEIGQQLKIKGFK
ncbi:DUF192 domain-containing protein [Shewanella woodyi]|uniref:DUF192 domain-containing protein n=1 Tax=Shewanella woodyi TaxID=60961 RepID=UPI0007F8F7D9|nr:DUF192 domain-containing protein [Shewanella woodyi]